MAVIKSGVTTDVATVDPTLKALFVKLVGASGALNLGTVDQGAGGVSAWKVDGSATTQPVSGTFWPAVQPVSGTVTANAGTGTFAVSGPLTDAQLRATSVPVTSSPATSGGHSIYRNIDLNATGALIKASAGQIYGGLITNTSTQDRFVKLYNKATAPTVGTDTPVMTIMLSGDQPTPFSVPAGLSFSLGIGIGATTGVADANTTAPAANEVVCNLFYT